MSLYVRLLTNFYTHRKTAKLRATLGDDALWLPPRLWAYAAENQPDGVFKNYTAAELANLIGYTKDANTMLEALLEAGFLDSRPLRIHDWSDHNGFHLVFATRAKRAAKARWQKERSKEKDQTRPDPTIPDHTVPDQTRDDASIASSIAPLAELRRSPDTGKDGLDANVKALVSDGGTGLDVSGLVTKLTSQAGTPTIEDALGVAQPIYPTVWSEAERWVRSWYAAKTKDRWQDKHGHPIRNWKKNLQAYCDSAWRELRGIKRA